MQNNQTLIGHIQQLQVQRSGLKVGHAQRVYDPAPLLAVEEAILSVQGIIGVTHDGQRITDAHHSEHPDSRNNNGVNSISIGFSVCYQDMRDKFGDHMTDGVAGENILIESECTFSIDDLIGGFVIHSASDQRINLTGLRIATPCDEFSTFAAQKSAPITPQQKKDALQFLNNGRRGYYCSLDTHAQLQQATLRVGDAVYLLG